MGVDLVNVRDTLDVHMTVMGVLSPVNKCRSSKSGAFEIHDRSVKSMDCQAS